MTEAPSIKEALEPCPFCASRPHQGPTKMERCQLHSEPFQLYAIWCPRGHAKIVAADQERAAAEWNTRAAFQPSGERREAIARIIDPDAYNGRAGHHDMYPRRANATAKACTILALKPSRGGWRLVPLKPTGQQIEQAAYNLADEFGPEYVLEHRAFAMAAYEELVAANPSGFVQNEAGIRGGYVLVPSEPTQAMVTAGEEVCCASARDNCATVYRAMIAAIRSARDGGEA